MTLSAWAANPIIWREKNIDWGEVAVSEVSRDKGYVSGLKLSTSSLTTETIETRTLLLADGHRLRIRERIEPNAQGGEDRVYLSGEKLDELRIVADDSTIEDVLKTLRELGCPIIRRYGKTGIIVRARISPTVDGAVVFQALSACGVNGSVKAQLSPMNFYRTMAEPSTKPNDPLLNYQWHLGQVGVTNVWQNEKFGFPDIKCAVFDTGVKLTHEDLQLNIKTRVSALKSDLSPEDHHGHGSHCLGIMGADGNNGKGISGVGQIANLTSIRGPISYGTTEDDILDGYQYALDHNIKVLSCSFGTSPGVAGDEATCKIIGELQANGCLVVIAAGNDGNDNDRVPTYPASYTNENIISVIATGKNDQPTNGDEHGWNTSYGATSCDIAAPGSEILSCTRDSESSYEAWEGTSMATPLVAACAAMVWQAHPDWTWREVRDRLYATATPNSSLIGYCATGARVNLEAALNQQFTLVVDPLDKKAYEVGETINIKVRVSEGVAYVNLTMVNRDDESKVVPLGPYEVQTGENTISVTLIDDDVGRGWLFKLEGDGIAAEAVGYSSVFRVREAGKVETIAVTKPTEGLKLDAANIDIAFTPSDALYADLALEHLSTNGTWTLETTLGLVACTPGKQKSTTIELKGLGWISETPYRIVVADNDDPSIIGRSAEFYIDRSTMSVTMEVEGLVPETDNVWEIGVEKRVTCRLPQTDLYWLMLVDNASGEVMVLKETWTDIRDPIYQKTRQFGLTIPEEVGIYDDEGNPREFYLELVDAFDMTMYRTSPVFTLAPRSDGLKEPTIGEALNAPTNYYFQGNGQWYPSRTSNSWELKCGYVGAGESAFFEADVIGPLTVRYDIRKNDFPGTLKFEYAKAPIMKATTWYEVVNGRIPAGAWRIRWTYERTDDTEQPEGRLLDLALSNMSMLLTMPDVKIVIKNDTQGDYLRITGGAYPTNVYYTLDGSTPTRASPLWVDGMNVSPYKFRLNRSMRIRAFADMEGAEPGLVATKDYFYQKGTGTEEDPIRIEDKYDLASFASWVKDGHDCKGLYVSMTNDIDMTGLSMNSIGIWEDGVDEEGTEIQIHHPFLGTFNGNNHILANVDIVDVIDHFGPKRFLFCDVGAGTLVRNLTLAKTNCNMMFVDEELGTEAITENCTESKTVPSVFNPPPFAPPDYRDYGKPTAITPWLFCDASPLFDENKVTLPAPGSVLRNLTSDKQQGPWIVRYTTNGEAPTLSSGKLPSTLPLLRSFRLKARVYAEPWYEPSPVTTIDFVAEFPEIVLPLYFSIQ